jgi:hypothetical protein
MKGKNKIIGFSLLGEAIQKGAYKDFAVVEDRSSLKHLEQNKII